MPFTKEPANAPAEIGRVAIHMEALTTGSVTVDIATVNFQVLDAVGGVLRERAYDLLPNLTAVQKNTLFSMLSAIRAKAKTEAI